MAIEKEIDILREKARSENWDTCQYAVARLAAINSDEATAILLDMLRSNDTQVMDLAAMAMRDTKDQKYFQPILEKIKSLGVKGKIESLVTALEKMDCSRNLQDIAALNLNFSKNALVKRSTTAILNEQTFVLTKGELTALEELLLKFDFSMDGFDVKYEILN